MKSYLKLLGLATAGVLAMSASTSFAQTAEEEIATMEAECIAKAEEMKAANMPDAEKAAEDCLAKVDEMKAGAEGAVEAIPEKTE